MARAIRRRGTIRGAVAHLTPSTAGREAKALREALQEAALESPDTAFLMIY